jgi:outer membrane protein
MNPRFFAIACPVALGLASLASPAIGEDLVQIYREALRADPAIASAQANWVATQEKAPQARAGLLPNVTATASGNVYTFDQNIRSDSTLDVNRNFRQYNAIVSASQPLFRYQNLVLYDQSKQQVTQADYMQAPRSGT